MPLIRRKKDRHPGLDKDLFIGHVVGRVFRTIDPLVIDNRIKSIIYRVWRPFTRPAYGVVEEIVSHVKRSVLTFQKTGDVLPPGLRMVPVFLRFVQPAVERGDYTNAMWALIAFYTLFWVMQYGGFNEREWVGRNKSDLEIRAVGNSLFRAMNV